MKEIDLTNYPEIPEGAKASFNSHYNLYQVYTTSYGYNPATGKKQTIKTTIGSIKDGKFKMGALYAVNQEKDNLQKQLNEALKKIQILKKQISKLEQNKSSFLEPKKEPLESKMSSSLEPKKEPLESKMSSSLEQEKESILKKR